MKILKGRSGITVLYKRVPSKFVDIRYGVSCGSVDELSKQTEGLCHALEHMFFRGTSVRNWEEISRGAKRLGAYQNAETDYGHTLYQLNVPKNNFAAGFEILADCTYNSVFDPEWWEIEKGAIITELLGRADDDGLAFIEAAYIHALGTRAHSIGGRTENISRASVKDLLRFRELYYTGKNLVVAVAGDLSSKEVLRVLNKYDRWVPKKPLQRKKLSLRFNIDPFKMKRKGITQTHIALLRPITVSGAKEEIAIAVACDVLSALLFERLREEQGLCYGVGTSYFESIPSIKLLEIATTVPHENKNKVLKEIENTVSYFIKEGLQTGRIEEARALINRRLLVATDSSMSATRSMLEAHFEGIKRDPLASLVESLNSTSDKYIINYVRKHFSGKFKQCLLVEG